MGLLQTHYVLGLSILFPGKHLKKKKKFFGTCATMTHRRDTLLFLSCLLDSSLEVHIRRVCVHPLGLSEHEEGTEANAVNSSHQVENRNPGASCLNQVASQVHANDTWDRREEKEMQRLWGQILPGSEDRTPRERMSRRKALYLGGLRLYSQRLSRNERNRILETHRHERLHPGSHPLPGRHAQLNVLLMAGTTEPRPHPLPSVQASIWQIWQKNTASWCGCPPPAMAGVLQKEAEAAHTEQTLYRATPAQTVTVTTVSPPVHTASPAQPNPHRSPYRTASQHTRGPGPVRLLKCH